MPDEENTKFCAKHGVPVDAALICAQCRVEDANKWLYQQRPDLVPGHVGEFAAVLARYNKDKWTEAEWVRKRASYPPHMYYLCDRCKYFNFHQLNYCPFCGAVLRAEKTTSTDLAAKYADYRRGF